MIAEQEILCLTTIEQLNNPIEYNEWLDNYICIQGIDITASAYQGVVNGTWYDITVGQVLDKSRNVCTWQKVFQRRLCQMNNNADICHFLNVFTEKALEIGYQF